MVGAILVLTAAVTTSAVAATFPWLRRDEAPMESWERRTAFVILLGDAIYQWLALAHVGDDGGDPTWLASLTILLVAGMSFAIYLAVRGFELPGVVRWPLAGILGLVQPVLLGASFVAVNGPIPLW